MTKWVVAQQHEVDAPDAIDDAVVDAWIAAACDAFVEQCVRLRAMRDDAGLLLVAAPAERAAPAFGRATEVIVSASATEVYPDSFTVAVKLRPVGEGAGSILNTTCAFRLVDPANEPQALGNEIRDELIALAHAAQHYN